MDIGSWSQLIGSFGFPIAACCFMFYVYDMTIKENSKILTEIKDALNALKEMLNDSRNGE